MHNRHLIDVKGLGMGVAYSPLEGLRLAGRLLEGRPEPVGVERYAVSTEDMDYRLRPDLGEIDILLLEITVHTNVMLGELCLNRCPILTHFIAGLGEPHEPAHHLGLRWFSHGLMKRDEEVRRETVELLLQQIQGTPLDTDDTRMLITQARGERESVERMVEHTAALQALIGAPRLVVVYGPNQFLPDGRGISWHANLEADARELATRLDAAFVSIGELVRERGFDFAVLPDMTHHTERFMGVIGDAVLAAAHEHYGALRPLFGRSAQGA
ncbi:hypothetical protein BH09PSE2_BH09PSE2_02200 [soil metagenome]